MFRKILVANRGEIAVRIIRTCREMGIATVAIYSDADREAKHVRLADEACAVGAAPPAESYLNVDRVLDAAGSAGANAIHPGYGFLSENAEFAQACEGAGIKFIGPPAAAIRSMGIKTRARELMSQAGVPVVPGTPEATDSRQAAALASQIGYPVMLKASAGGGGKGMRLVESAAQLESAWEQAQGEALEAFGDGAVYLEKAILRPHHVEVQILADEHGAVVHLGERECSLQRRHQKVLEESPSPLVEANPHVREQLYSAAIAAASAIGYANAGTIEFLMDADCRFYFLEMNTRLQVEHPVTELVTGMDLVKQQIRVAAGETLGFSQEAVRFRGHAMECRVYAEDASANFMPSPGLIRRMAMPGGPGIRVDSGADEGWTVPIHYDPLIAKLCAWAPTRAEAIDRLRGALREATISGIATTLGFFRELMEDPQFQAGDIDTGFLARGIDPAASAASAPSLEARLAAVLAVIQAEQGRAADQASASLQPNSAWKRYGRIESVAARGTGR
ncbi:MAG: acetyl-CoA carboxylase biotin carboxylase subunit [Bryobacterales bacterium]|nr:acetyl-CoA carboxylase biotin carboxylase subunit [Bryobacterales bacterium]